MRALPIILLISLAVPAAQTDLAAAVAFYSRGDYRQAAERFEQIILSSPRDADAHVWLGKSYLKLRRWDNAIEEFTRAVQLDSDNALNHLWLGRAFGGKAAHVSSLFAFPWARKVVREFETARKLSPNNLDVRFDLLEFYLEAPGIVGGGQDKAEAEAREIARISPRAGHAARAAMHLKKKRWDLARTEYEAATRAFPDVADTWGDMARFLCERSDYVGAEVNARKALEVKKSYPNAQLLLARAGIGQQKDVPDAERALKALSAGPLGDEDPSLEDIYYWLGQAYLQQGKRSEAREAFEISLRYDPDYAEAKSALSKLR